MAGNIRGHIAGLLRTSKRHSRYVGVLALLAVVVAFGVTMGLRRNGRAATVEQTVLDCHAAAGVAHTHNADCYVGGDLVCPLQERELHVHDDSCYDEAGNLTCGKEEAAEEHVHGAGCFKTVTVTVDEAEAQPAEATAETTADAPKAGELTASKDGYDVTVSYGADAKVPDGARLSVKALSENSSEYKAAREAVLAQKQAEDKDFDETTLGMAAVDISILDASGAEVEPSGSVKVSLKMTELPKNVDESVLNASLEVLHLDESSGNTVVETVAASDEVKVAGDTAKASFTVDSFSTFTLTWDGGSATVHWGTVEGGSFKEFDNEEVVSLDATKDTVSLKTNYSGYVFANAYYVDPSDSNNNKKVEPTLYKADSGWAVDEYVTDYQSDTTTIERNPLPDGADLYVTYTVPTSPNPVTPSGANIPTPETKKTVTDNGDGTYTVQIDVTGKEITEQDKVGANVLIVLDNTSSMGLEMGNTTRWPVAKKAINTLVTALSTGENANNDIQYALIDFHCESDGGYYYRTRWNVNRLHSWSQSTGQHENSGTNYWTSNATQFNNYIQSNSYTWSDRTDGTNWESPLTDAKTILNSRDGDATYVIFVTDGEPNCAGTNRVYTYDYNDVVTPAIDAAKDISSLQNVQLYGVFCGNDNGYQTLNGVITNGGGVQTVDGSSEKAMTDAFAGIAHNIIENLGASNVSVDDGVPDLASVSASVSGEASGFEYEKNGQPWADAPGAAYNEANGVTWDLSKAGTLESGAVYTIRFTVWPSQEAYDLIADLNNGVITKDDAELEKLNIVKDSSGKYTLKTNSHLSTSYSFKGTTYTDPITWTNEEMDLPTEVINVKKIWNNPVDSHIGDGTSNGVKLYLTKDGKNYLYGDNAITVAPDGPNDLVWESEEDIYISCGFIKQNTSTHAYEILESGHDYSIAEPESFAYYWDLKADVYHPMVINGVARYLVQDDSVSGTDGVDYYTIKGHKYVIADEGDNVLTATNDRRSNLNLKKDINDLSTDQGADRDTLFQYTITVNNPNAAKGSANDTHSDYYVWFSVYDPVADGFVTNLDTNATAEAGSTGYYYAPSGSAITVSIKEGWGLRFLNLPKGTTYTITESVSGDWEFEGAAGSAIRYEKDSAGQPVQVEDTYNPDVNTGTATVSGSVLESNHSYSIAVTNKFEPQGNNLTVNKVWKSGNFVTNHGTVKVALYKNGAVVPDTVRKITAPDTSVTYDKITSLDGLEVREVVVDGDAVTAVGENGTIAVSGETTTLGSNATDTYVVTYSTGTVTGSGRTDTVTNTMPTLVVNKQDMDGNQLAGATFKLTGADGETALTGYESITSTGEGSGNLLKGIYLSNGKYYLVETEAPSGYNKLTYKVRIVVDNGSAIMTAATDPASTTSISDQTDDNKLLYTFNVKNSDGTELPNAGGPGTAVFNILGSAIAVAAILTYGLLSRRTSEGRSWV